MTRSTLPPTKSSTYSSKPEPLTISDHDVLTKRVERLEQRQTKLEQQQNVLEAATLRLTNSMRSIRGRVAAIEKLVAKLPDKNDLAEQTNQIRVIVAESETRNTERLLAAAGSWPPTAVALVTIAGALIVGIILVAIGAIHPG